MDKIGIKELEARASEIVREVREQQASYVVTQGGRPVGLLTPFEEESEITSPRLEYGAADAWEELRNLGAEIARRWTSEKSSASLVSEMRR